MAPHIPLRCGGPARAGAVVSRTYSMEAAQMELRNIARLLALSAVLAVAACDDDEDDDNGTGPEQEFANVRIVNASSTTANAEVRVGDEVLAASVPFGQGTAQCVQVPAGSRQLSFRAGGSQVAQTQSFNFQADQSY